MYIELHADDFGATPSVNKNILSAWYAGALDGVSVIANGEGIYEAAKEIKTDINRPLRLAVHLNLSEGRPLVDTQLVKLLVDKDGYFLHSFLGIWTLWHSCSKLQRQELLEQVKAEWREQIRRVIDLFFPRPVTRVDGHIHIHMLPFLFPVAVELAREFNIPEIRISREIYHLSFKDSLGFHFVLNNFKHLLLNVLAGPARKIAKDLVSPDAVAGILYSGHMTYETTLAAVKAAKKAKLNWLELIFHPGRATPLEANRWKGKQAFLARFYRAYHRDVERDTLIRIAKEGLF